MMLEGAIGHTSGGLHVGSGTGSVSGAVTGPSGAPQAGVWVRVTMEDLYSSTWFARTDGSGAYTVTGLPTGEYHVAFSTWPNCYDDGWKVVSSAYYDSVGVVDGANTPNINIRLHALPQAIYRFFHKGNGTHFYTPTEGERDKVIAEWSSIYRYEGVAYHVDAAISPQPLYRFFNLKNGSHFYTASATERDKVRATWPNIYRYEGETYSVSPSAQPGTKAVHRFFKYDTGSHFYTASVEERDTVQANWPRIFRYEGAAFYVNQ